MLIDIPEAKNRLSELIQAAREGEEVIITSGGRPVATLAAVDNAEKALTGSAAAILGWLDNHPTPRAIRRSAAGIDAATVIPAFSPR